MKCEKCGKLADVHLTEIKNGKKTDTDKGSLLVLCGRVPLSVMRALFYINSAWLIALAVGCAHKSDCDLTEVPVPMSAVIRDCVSRADATAEQQIRKLNADPRYRDSGSEGSLSLEDYRRSVREGCLHGRPVISVAYELVRKSRSQIHILDGPNDIDVLVYLDSDEIKVQQ